MPKHTTVESYIAAASPVARRMMKQLRAAIRSVAHNTTEKISYGLPFYEYKYPGYRGRLVYFGAFRNHVSIFAWGREVNNMKGLKKYQTSKGTLQFPLGSQLPIGLIKQVVKARMRQIDQSIKHRASIKRPL